MAERLVVIGGDAGGMSAASQARRRRKPEDLEIVAFERGQRTSYTACGIPYLVAGDVHDPAQLVVRDAETFRSEYAIDARTEHEVVAIDLDRRTVRVRHDGHEADEGFDKLVYATGSTPVRPSLPGVDATGVYGVQTLGDGEEILRVLAAEQPREAVVVGAGYIGLEMAEAMLRRGLHVSIVEQAPQPLATLDPDMGAIVAGAIRAMRIDLYLDEGVRGFETADGQVSAVVTQARTLPADIVILGLGVRPNTELAKDAGVELGVRGGVITDRQMRTSAEGVWAAGDCVVSHHRVSRQPVVIALGTHANKQGRVAGINIGGGYATFPGVVGTAASKICDYEVARTGLTEREATEAGFAFVTASVESTTRAGYFPGAAPMTTKLLAERGTGRLLGGQIVGKKGAAKRIDVIATVLWNEMDVEEMLALDLSYAPPFSPVWDPVLIAARKAAEALG